MALKLTSDVLQAILLAITDTGGPLDPAATFLGVYTAIDDQGQDTLLADVVQATGAMAVRQALTTWSTPSRMADGRWVCDSPAYEFRPASSAESQVLTGSFLATLATLGALKGYEDFPGPVALPDEDHSVSLVVRAAVDPTGRWGTQIVWNG